MVIHVDSTYAINIAEGRWLPKEANKRLGELLHARYRTLRRARGSKRIRIRHVRAHQGTMGNEKADALAKEAAALGQTPRAPRRDQPTRPSTHPKAPPHPPLNPNPRRTPHSTAHPTQPYSSHSTLSPHVRDATSISTTPTLSPSTTAWPRTGVG